ncbi:MAG: LCP family protein, partial [Clostridia bacterium]|nr:LCP family protein [Clostridia bacterium]
MLKKLLCLVLVLLTMLSAIPSAYARQPKDITPIPYDEVPEPVEGQHHYLLMCVDQWQGKTGNLGNTDGMVLVTLDTRARRVMLTSFIRDLLVLRPDGKIGRINYIAKNYGPEALCQIISTHFGVKVEKFILFDMKQVQEIINHLGGVDITVTDAEANYLRRYAISKTSTTPSMGRAGTYRFNGHAAV